ncbi:unnamed protein product [Brachionus calyciflorus]|nr:unnamed protein product [Brachionus calyciflorus]
MGMYYRLISVYNIFVLVLSWLYLISKSHSFNLNLINEIGCRLFSYFFRITYQICSWLNVLVTFDRLVFILFPTRFKILKNKAYIMGLFFSSHIFFILVNIPSLFFNFTSLSLNVSNVTYKCEQCWADHSIFLLRTITSQIVGVYIPFFLMITLNSILFIKVFKSHHRLKHQIQMGKDIHFAFTLICSNILFIILLTPYSIYIIILSTFMESETLSLSLNVYLSLFETITIAIYCINYSMSFIIQILFNKMFRKEVKMTIFKFLSILTGKQHIVHDSSTNHTLH